ncbi:uncharacterized protein A4U43_C01F30390 [Asparagus officinalis]|uniref:Transmembrane protein n=1 Tax=Asparagus officinalis TaxID=4686 RepID=A0A5P1FTJ7_ASPOF|nr:uncharacterized protein LOC109844162 [Asparagus officinalis]ONK81548.1 uncharacterized protein A4U43_C01F30390 [Asparagus officinalis]
MQSSYSILVFFVAAFATIGLCASAVIRKRRIQAEQSGSETEQSVSKWQEIKKVLKSALRLKDESDAAEAESGDREERGEKVEKAAATNTPLLWQRRILMGERCEMPKFSGLILYDERGRPLQSGNNSNGQEKPAAPVITLKDLM